MKVLIPVGSSHNSEFAVRHAVKRFMNDNTMEVHLLNVQRPFSRHISHHASGKTVHEYHHAQSQEALEPCMKILDSFGVPYAVHMAVGEHAACITQTAKRLHCDEIIMSTARQNSLTRLLENSLTTQVLDLTTVPVEVVTGDAISPWERYGIPAAIAALLALWFAAAD